MSGLFEHGYPYTDAHELNLSWVILKVKELAEAWAKVQQDWTDEQAAFANLQSWIENYFNNLNVQTEINVKLDAMVAAGTMSELIAPYVASGLPAEVAAQIGDVVAAQIGPVVAAQIGAVVADQLPAVAAAAAASEVSAWLAAHVNPETGYVIDDSLTVQGAAADAKATGDEVTAIKSALTELMTDAETQDVITMAGYAIYQSSGNWKISNVGSGYSSDYFKMEDGYVYTLTTDAQTPIRYGFNNSYPGYSTNVYNSNTFNGSVVLTKTDTNAWCFVNNNDHSLTVTTRKIKNQETSEYLKKDITSIFEFENGKAIIGNEQSADYGKAVSATGYKASGFTEIAKYKKLVMCFASIIRTSSSKNVGLCFYDGSQAPISGIIQLEDYQSRNNVMEITVPSEAYYVRTCCKTGDGMADFYCYGLEDVESSKFVDFDYWAKKEIRIAAYNATRQEKENADFICDGTADEEEIKKALSFAKFAYNCTILLSSGDFYIDSFTDYNGKKIAIELSVLNWNVVFHKHIKGIHKVGEQWVTNIHVTETALTMLGNDVGYIFSTKTYVYGRQMDYSNLRIALHDNQHKVTIIDNSIVSAGICSNLTLGATDPIINNSSMPMPVENCVGITGFSGDDNGTQNRMDNILCLGFYEGFRLGGEHLVGINLGGRYNYIAYTFGHYDWNSGMQSHPITLINCCDEYSAYLPQFYRSGASDRESQATRQQVDLIGFNMELSRIENFGGGYVQPCSETVDGAFCGRIEFTGYGTSNVGKNESPSGTNLKAIKFWDDNKGHEFRTVNMTHELAGTTVQRLTYEPTYMQQYYDTTLNKLLIFDGTNWIDTSGNVVS